MRTTSAERSMSDAATNPAVPGNESDTLQNTGSAATGIGARLRAQREANAWTIEQVASHLNLAPRQIQALEGDDFDALPGMASVRGFIRGYAKLLKIDAEPLMDLLGSHYAMSAESLDIKPSLATPFSDTVRLPSLAGNAPSSKSVFRIVAAALVALAAVGFALHQFGWLPLSAEPDAMPDGFVAAPVETISEIGQVIAQPEVATVSTPESVVEPEMATVEETVSESAPEVAEPVVKDTPEASAVAGANALILKMREDSWIEVRRAGEGTGNRAAGNVVMARLAKSGTSETIDIDGPVVLTVGNVAGVDATLRGESLNLTAGARNNVVRLNLN
jgi:cytoskeleton protein RodZ